MTSIHHLDHEAAAGAIPHQKTNRHESEKMRKARAGRVAALMAAVPRMLTASLTGATAEPGGAAAALADGRSVVDGRQNIDDTHYQAAEYLLSSADVG